MVFVGVYRMLLKLFYITLIAELFLGGGGRLTEIGSNTLRMYLFSTALCLMLLPQFWRRVGADVRLAFGMVALFFLVHLPGLIFGLVRGVDANVVFVELQPLMYFMMAPFFAQVLSKKQYVELTSNFVRDAGLLLASAFIITLLCILIGLLDFSITYNVLNSTGEFMFRGVDGLFFYKGFLYLCIALIFILAKNESYRNLSIILVSSAIILTLTRGFMLSTMIAASLFFFLTGNRKALALMVMTSIIVAAMVLGYLPFETILTRKDGDFSDHIRYADIDFMLKNVDALSLIFGNGFGALISDSRLNIENSFLWIWWKIGLAGLLFWFSPLMLCYIAFKRIPASSINFSLGCAYFCAVILIYIQSATNPYLNNPIGLSFVLISIFSLRTLARDHLDTSSLALKLTKN